MSLSTHFNAVMLLMLLLASCGKSAQHEAASLADELAHPSDTGLYRAVSQPAFRVDLDTASDEYGVISLSGLHRDLLLLLSAAEPEAPAWPAFFQVYQQDTRLEDPDAPPVMGRYSVTDSQIRFHPRFTPVPGLTYRVILDSTAIANQFSLWPEMAVRRLDTLFTIPRARGQSETTVTQVYPSADSLPANLLKFYLHFSSPMATGEAYTHISLRDLSTGEPVFAPFVEIDPELWDPTHRRLTLFFDPGRVKREVGPNREVGPPLVQGITYQLHINGDWKDASGAPLRQEFSKTFHVIEPDRIMPVMTTWEMDLPEAGTREALTVRFPESMDNALLQRVLRIVDDADRLIVGDIVVRDREQRWALVPDRTWQAGTYRLEAETILEDVAGNSLNSLFDVDLTHSDTSEEREDMLVESLSFTIHENQPPSP